MLVLTKEKAQTITLEGEGANQYFRTQDCGNTMTLFVAAAPGTEVVIKRGVIEYGEHEPRHVITDNATASFNGAAFTLHKGVDYFVSYGDKSVIVRTSNSSEPKTLAQQVREQRIRKAVRDHGFRVMSADKALQAA